MIDIYPNMAIMGIATVDKRTHNLISNFLIIKLQLVRNRLLTVAGKQALLTGCTLVKKGCSMEIRLGDPVNVKLLLCKECGIHTNHRRTASGAWVCWCGAVYAGSVQS